MPIKTVPIELTEKDIERFWSYVDKRGPDECWEWTGTFGARGYGQLGVNYKMLSAHRISETIARADPGPLFVCHHCDNPRCVNPRHLFVGTQDDNVQDMISKSREARGEGHGKSRLSVQDIKRMRNLYMGGMIQQELACVFGVSRVQICRILRGDCWGHIPLPYTRQQYREIAKQHYREGMACTRKS